MTETERCILSSHIQKLGHSLQEIRERALKNIISKLDHGFVFDNDLARSREVLQKLFEWFLFQQCTHEEVVLKLIRRILEAESGLVLLKHYGSKVISSELRQVRSCIEPRYYALVDEILEFVKRQLENETKIVPPLQADVPLSYRSCDSSYPIKVGSTATPIEGFVYHIPSLDQQTGVVSNRTSESEHDIQSESDVAVSCLPYYTFCWQQLVTPDRHVLESVEDSLRNPSQPSALLHSCKFFTDVMIHDFPAEVFLQRPGIVMMFYKLITASSSSRVAAAIISCLLKLSKLLQIRINYYSDPCTHSLKQIMIARACSNLSSPAASEKVYLSTDRSAYSSTSSDEEKSEDVAALKLREMSLPDYCLISMKYVLDYLHVKHENLSGSTARKKSQVGINGALLLIMKLIELLTLCVKPEIWTHERQNVVRVFFNSFTEVLMKFGGVIEGLRLEVISTDYEKTVRVIQLHILCSCTLLLHHLVPLDKIDVILPRNLKNALSSNLLDLTFARLYPKIHKKLLNFVQEFGGRYELDSIAKYEQINDICVSMKSCVQLLRKHKSLPVVDCIKLTKDSLRSVEFHKNLSILKIFVDLCANKLPMCSFQDDILQLVEDITLFLLAHNDVAVRTEMYRLCYKKIVGAIGPKLNSSKAGAPGSQILFLTKSQVLIEMGMHGVTSDNVEIQRCAEDILIHILKCKILVSDQIWDSIVEAIIPCLPILVCYADKETVLGRTIVSMLDPDKALALRIAMAEVLKGNVCLLFHNDSLVREEAVSRLCWLMSSEHNAREMLPRLNNLHDKALSIVCHIQHVFDLNKMRSSQHFYQPSSLHQVLQLLSSEKVEPVIRRSALTQIAVMLEDPLIHGAFLQNEGIQTIIKVMKSALTESSYSDYPDSILPCVSILKSVCSYSSSMRQELSYNLEVLNYTLRGLFLFCTEDRMKQDGSILLFLLLFGSFVTGSPSKGDLALPKLVVEKLRAPFSCKSHSQSSKHTPESLTMTVLQDKWRLASLQIHWNSEWFGGFNELLNWDRIDYGGEGVGEDFSEALQMSATDLFLVQRSSPQFCMEMYLSTIQNATNHEVVIDSVNNLTTYVNLYKSVQTECVFESNFLSLPWKETFVRFLNVQPSSDNDSELLICVLQFLNVLLPFYKHTDSDCWLIRLLKDRTNPLLDVLRVDAYQDTETKDLSQELLHIITSCVCHEQHYLELYDSENPNATRASSSWSHVIEVVAENLKFSDAQHFYNLAYLDCLLSCLVHLTATLGWSQSKSGLPPKLILVQLVTGLCEMIGAFHCSKGSTAAASLMGISITRHAVLILNHLLVEMQHYNVKGWETCFVEEESGVENAIPNLSALCASRDVVLRAAVYQLFAGLALSNRCATELVQGLKSRGGGLWEASLFVLLDHEEASVVRENVANLLANFASHTVTVAGEGCTIDIGVAPTNTKQASSVNAVMKLLNEANFYKELEVMLSCLYTSGVFYFNKTDLLKMCEDSCKDATARNKYVQSHHGDIALTSQSSSSSYSNNGILVVTTPSLIASLSALLYNLLLLSSNEVSHRLQEHGIIKLLFKSLCVPELELRNTRDVALYCDMLEMNAAICTVLNAAASVNSACLSTVLHTRDCLNILLMLLNPSIYHTSLTQLLYLRNKLWCEIFALIEVSLNYDGENGNMNALGIISLALSDCGHQPFLQTLCEAISDNNSVDLQHSALCSLTALLKSDGNVNEFEASEKSMSMQDLLDNTEIPRRWNNKENLENATSEENIFSNNFEDLYLRKLNCNSRIIRQQARQVNSDETDEDCLMAGAELCKILLHLHDVVSLSHNSQNVKKKSAIFAALTCILGVSREAKKYALHNGLLELAVRQLRDIHLKLSLESVESLRRVSDKKRLSPVLKEIGCLIGLITNFVLGDASVKNAASILGLADLIHKLWIWLNTQKQLLIDGLKLLCTYTTGCLMACQSLSLTSSVAGSGPRKVPSNTSVLHAVVSLISKEMDQVSRTHDLAVLELCFHLLHNSCCSIECRIILSKTHLLQCTSRLHPAITKRQKPWEHIELIWLEFLETFTSHPEGQVLVAKIPDVLELIISLANSMKLANRQTAMVVLRNASFYHSNRPRLLTSAEFLNVLESKLTSGSLEEKNMVVTIMWSLMANNQKAKLILKCAGLDVKLQETLKILHLSDFKVNTSDLDRMHYVLNMLKDNDK